MENLTELTHPELSGKLEKIELFFQHKTKEVDWKFFDNRLIRTYTFSGTKLGSTIAYNTKFIGCIFDSADLSASWLNTWRFQDCFFKNCNIAKVDMASMEFLNCKFEDCNFNRATIQTSVFMDCNFMNCTFMYAVFLRSELVSCTFKGSPDVRDILKETKTTDVVWH